jgi:hypothetical protein
MKKNYKLIIYKLIMERNIIVYSASLILQNIAVVVQEQKKSTTSL